MVLGSVSEQEGRGVRRRSQSTCLLRRRSRGLKPPLAHVSLSPLSIHPAVNG